MSKFSVRNGYVDKVQLTLENVPETLRNRIWNLFFREEIQKGGLNSERMKFAINGEPFIEDRILDRLGYIIPKNGIKLENARLNKIKEHLLFCEWYQVFDFIEIHISLVNADQKKNIINAYNSLLAEEGVLYRLVGEIISPIYNDGDIETIETAISTEYASVNTHIQKALSLFSSRKLPDYENSIKESISAVEAMCCIINGKNETLNKAIKKLKDSGVHIHSAMENAFISLYGYTSDEKGIRHAGMDFVNASAEDAKYMLVSCSAFVNYLIEKWSKVNG